MKLKDLLLERKSSIIKKWFDSIIEDYPADSSNFFKKQKNPFLNPVGQTISEGIAGLFDGLLQSSDSEKFFPFLNDIIRIRAVQDFSPSKAVSFIFLLKQAVREQLESEIRRNEISDELTLFESQIDSLALLSFDVYMKCRERIYEIKADETIRTTYRLLQRANLICDLRDRESDAGPETISTQNIKG
jgi:hypothetical protein